jgi:hypothetical protein
VQLVVLAAAVQAAPAAEQELLDKVLLVVKAAV